MFNQFRNAKGRRGNVTLFMTGLLVLGAGVLLTSALFTRTPIAQAADPGGGTLGANATSALVWKGTALGGVSPNSEADCGDGTNCDTYKLTISGTPADWNGKVAHVEITWATLAHDYALSIHKGDTSGPIVAYSDNPVDSPRAWEMADIDPNVWGTGEYSVRVIYFAATALDQYEGTASVDVKPASSLDSGKAKSKIPTFVNYAAPATIGTKGNNAGEPSIGVNWNTGNVMYIAKWYTLRVAFDDSTSPATATWADKSFPTTNEVTFDPILKTDSETGRTYVSQLLPNKASLLAFTDDDGETWMQSQGSGINSGVDHQTIGTGPYAKNSDGTFKGNALPRPGPDSKGGIVIYPNAVYYASQDVAAAEFARSDDGGFTYGPAVPMYDLTECGGLHGHIKVAPDGTIYVPNKNCKAVTGVFASKDTDQAVLVSEDNGVTWEVRRVPGSSAGRTDPSVGIGSDGTVYFAYADGDGHARVAVSKDKGRTWGSVQDLGSPFGVQNSVFPAAVAGDGNRAAVFFLGTTGPGDGAYSDDPLAFDGVWYGYIATTYDGGKSWFSVNATANDPVQRGPVCTKGTTCGGSRNLLDFNDLAVDRQGRVLAAYADGCITDECKQGVDLNSDGVIQGRGADKKATIIRQSSGTGLFSAFRIPKR